MTISLPEEKTQELIKLCKAMQRKRFVVIKDLAVLVVKLVASEPAVEYSPHRYKNLEHDKDSALKTKKKG